MNVGELDPLAVVALTQTVAVQYQCRMVAAAIAEEARRRVTVRSGNLKKNIAFTNVINKMDGQTEYRVGFYRTAFYGQFIELGTSRAPAQPFLRPAADVVRQGLTTTA